MASNRIAPSGWAATRSRVVSTSFFSPGQRASCRGAVPVMGAAVDPHLPRARRVVDARLPAASRVDVVHALRSE